MSRRSNGSSSVRGPTSALTEFLRERGITARNPNRFARAQPPGPAGSTDVGTDSSHTGSSNASPTRASTGPATTASPSTSTSAAAAASTSTPGPSTRARNGRRMTRASMRFEEEEEGEEEDDDDDEDSQMADVSAAGTPVAAAANGSRKRGRQTRASASAAKKDKQKKKKGKDDDYDDDDDEDDADFRPGPSNRRSAHTYKDKMPGAIDYCAICKAKFTVSKYTAQTPNGLLCHKCGPLWKPQDDGKPAAPKRRRGPKKTTMSEFEDFTRMPTLQDQCINIIGNYIEDVEALGDIGAVNLNKISKIISKNRKLNNKTAQLFLGRQTREITFYDCSNMDADGLISIAKFCPDLEVLSLFSCGQMSDETLDYYRDHLLNLRQLHLYAPFLVRVNSWKAFIEKVGPQLESFQVRQTLRFDLDCVKLLAEKAPQLSQLKLSEMGLFCDDALAPLHNFKNLRLLDLSTSGTPLKDDALIPLLSAVGVELESLILNDQPELTDKTLTSGIKPNCKRLRTLKFWDCAEISATGVKELFTEWTNSHGGLTDVNFGRCLDVDDEALGALVGHSGSTLEVLNLHSVDNLTDEAIKSLATSCKRLRELDVSFCRAVDDFVVRELLDNLDGLKVLRLAGCNRVSDYCPTKPGVKIFGRENPRT